MEAPASFDHVLVFRSRSHLVEPSAALRNLRRALRPGGTLTGVDNVAFGLARARPQARARLKRRDVGPGTSSQGLLRCSLEEGGA